MPENTNEQDNQNIIAIEQNTLGTILLNNELFHRIASILEPDHFIDPVHALIFETIQHRIERDSLASPVTIARDLEDNAGLKELGGGRYLISMAGSAFGSGQIVDYATEISDAATRRGMKAALEAAIDDLTGADGIETAKARVETVLAGMPARDGKESTVSFLSAMTKAIEQINNAYQGTDGGLKTSISAIDEKTGGLWPGDFVVLGGRPSMGKTALASSIAKRIADGGGKVVIASLEMGEDSLALRLLAEATHLNYSDMRQGHLSEAEMRRVIERAKEMTDLTIGFTPPHVNTIPSIMAAAKSERARMGGLDAVFIDYLQLVNSSGRGRYEVMSEVSRQIKAMARALNVPVIALSQLSRSVESRDDKRPTLSDLRETGQIEQDADLVAFCYRHEYYLQRMATPVGFEDQADHYAALEAAKNKMDVIVQKQRMGDTFTAKLGCHLPSNRFWDLDKQGGFDV